MKPALTLTFLLFAFILPLTPISAQEHVDVPLPAYDPPPQVSHHSEPHPDQRRRGRRQGRPPAKASPGHPSAKASPGHPSSSKGRAIKSSSPRHSYHRPLHRRH